MRKKMGSILAMPSLTFNPMRRSREATKVGSRLGKPGAREGGQLPDGGLRLHMHCSMMPESSVDKWQLRGTEKGWEREGWISSLFFLLLFLCGFFLPLSSIYLFESAIPILPFLLHPSLYLGGVKMRGRGSYNSHEMGRGPKAEGKVKKDDPLQKIACSWMQYLFLNY